MASATIPGWPPGTSVRTEHSQGCPAFRTAKGSSTSALGTWAEGQRRGGCRDKRQVGNTSCQLPEPCHTAARDFCQRSAWVEERALQLLSEAKLAAMWPFSSQKHHPDRARVTLKVTSNPHGLCSSPSPTQSCLNASSFSCSPPSQL